MAEIAKIIYSNKYKSIATIDYGNGGIIYAQPRFFELPREYKFLILLHFKFLNTTDLWQDYGKRLMEADIKAIEQIFKLFPNISKSGVLKFMMRTLSAGEYQSEAKKQRREQLLNTLN